jgi:hypothetical protein
VTLPTVLRGARVEWTPAAQLGPVAPSAALSCYQPVTQCQSNWCWAAVLQELLHCIDGVDVAQCALVEHYLGLQNCCPGPPCDPSAVSPCNQVGTLQDILNAEWPFPPPPPPSVVLAASLTADRLFAALALRQPVIGLFFNMMRRHYAVLSGVTPGNPQYNLEVSDPEDGVNRFISVTPGQRITLPAGWTLNTAYFMGVSEK